MPDDRLVQKAFDALMRGNFTAAMDSLSEYLKKSDGITCAEARMRLQQDYETAVSDAAISLNQQWRNGDFDGVISAFDRTVDAEVDHSPRVNDRRPLLQTLMFTVESIGDALNELSATAAQCYLADILHELEAEYGIHRACTPPSRGDVECDSCGEWAPGPPNSDKCTRCLGDEDDDGPSSS